MMDSFLIFFCFSCFSLHHFTHVAFFPLRGLLGPLLACVLLRTLLYIPMSFLLLNDTHDLLFRTVNELQDFQDMHYGAFHVNWDISQLPLASPLWST